MFRMTNSFSLKYWLRWQIQQSHSANTCLWDMLSSLKALDVKTSKNKKAFDLGKFKVFSSFLISAISIIFLILSFIVPYCAVILSFPVELPSTAFLYSPCLTYVRFHVFIPSAAHHVLQSSLYMHVSNTSSKSSLQPPRRYPQPPEEVLTILGREIFDLDETPADMRRRILDTQAYLRHEKRIPSQCSKLLDICLHQSRNMRLILEELQNLGSFNLTQYDVFRMVRKNPTILLKPNCTRTVANYLLQFKPQYVATRPAFPLSISYHYSNMTALASTPSEVKENSSAYFCEDGYLNASVVRRILVRNPTMVEKGVNILKQRIMALRNVGLSDYEICKGAKNFDGFFSCGRPQTKLQHLVKGGWFSSADALELLRRWPRLLSMNVERNIKPKLLYLQNEMYRQTREVLDFPQFLSYDLRQKIIPRHMAILRKFYPELWHHKLLKYTRKLKRGGWGYICNGFFNPNSLPISDQYNFNDFWNMFNVSPQISEMKSSSVTNLTALQAKKYYSSYFEAYNKSFPSLRLMLALSDDSFRRRFNISYRHFIEAKLDAEYIPNPQRIF